MVLPALHNAYCGVAQQPHWLVGTQQTGGAARSYDPELFCRDDRVVWVTGLTEVRRGRQVEDWGMDAPTTSCYTEIERKARAWPW